MVYRARPRFQAQVQTRPPARKASHHKNSVDRKSFEKNFLVAPAGRWEPGLVLDVLNEMHNTGRRAGS
jgi:hypothetical protein